MAQETISMKGYPGKFPARTTLSKNGARDVRERLVRLLMFSAALISIVTTLGIVVSLFADALGFFQHVSLGEFLGSTVWKPLFENPQYGIWALVSATITTSFVAIMIAVPLGLMAAVYLSEFASQRAREILKPMLEILAGIPTVVYGFFALLFVTPLLKNFIPELGTYNALSAGLVMGIMIMPMVASLSEDAMSAVPMALREGAFGLGATRFEVAVKVVFPAALSGIVASIILAMSRAVGETMIVSVAAGQNPLFSFNPLDSMATMTAFIVQVSLGDTPAGSLAYQTIFAVGATLFVLTFLMNAFSHWFVRRFREVYD